MLKKVALAVAAALAAQAASAASIDYHGYLRAGTGFNTEGGQQACYGTGGPDGHVVGRLGDECDMYSELSFGANVAKQGDQVWKVVSTIAFTTDESRTNTQGNSWQGTGNSPSDSGDAGSDFDRTSQGPWEGGRISVREMYAQATGVIGDSTVWFGKSFGDRKDIHIMDWFLLMNSGYGAGFRGLTAGPGKLSFQWISSNTNEGADDGGAAASASNWERYEKLDARYNFNIGKNHNLDLVAIYGLPNFNDAQEANVNDDSAVFLMVEHTLSGFLGGFNKASLTYATNGFADLHGNFGALTQGPWIGDADGIRFADHGVVSFGKMVDLAYAYMYSNVDQNGNWLDGDEHKVVVRPVFKWTDTMSTAVELGYYKENRGDSSDLSKVTVAQQWSPLNNGGGIWAKPSFRLFASFYDGDQANSNADTSVGAQVEAWW